MNELVLQSFYRSAQFIECLHQWLQEGMNVRWFVSPTPSIRLAPGGLILLHQGVLLYPSQRLMQGDNPFNNFFYIFFSGVSSLNKSPGRPSIWSDPFAFFGWQGLGKAKPILREGVGKGGNPLDEFW